MTGGPRLWGFPPPQQVPQLRWLGADYSALLVRDLEQGLLRQDPGTHVIAVKCEGEPRLITVGVDAAGYIRAHDAAFPLEILLSDGGGRSWRLRGRWTYAGRDLGTVHARVSHYWELFTADRV
ncbi:hypothetical protein LO762_22865 [Actinocorallia sp. API 0066]|uniref:hypothetical protein n=1 Tax=Actinocorallia sp. API 0066 TaxID=2896846 RepID=UPI001E34BBB5|nr:hypothetical protein [Actinocorallia sp. API 0066]MCD0452012.1 hypothetical protein [Actinocorallia sp. API 0066]